jgi:glucuronosyltransferase
MPWVPERMGVPENPSYCEDIYSYSDSRDGFVRRLRNAVRHWAGKLVFHLAMQPYSQKIAEAELGPLPPLSEIAANTSLLLLNTHFSFLKPRPYPPNIVEVSGLHIKPPKPLPQVIVPPSFFIHFFTRTQ